MNPMEDTEFMGQMASFSTLSRSPTSRLPTRRSPSNLTSTSAVGLLGRTVTWTGQDDVSHTGVVEKVTTAGGTPSLTVGGTDGVELSTISQVA